MSLLTGSNKKINFSYQLPLKFDEQLSILTKMQECINSETATIKWDMVWNYIKDNINICENGSDIWIKGELKDGKLENKMLGYSFKASRWFFGEFQNFTQEQGVEL